MIVLFKKFYRHLFQEKLFIIKVSGKIIIDQEARENLIDNIKELVDDNINILLIYGGGIAIDDALKKEGLEIRKVDGRRISLADDIMIIKKTLTGDLGFKILESLVKVKLPSNVLSALPPHWATSKPRDNFEGHKRFDGTLSKIDAKSVREHFTSTNLAVFPCLAFDDQGTALNINADNMAIALARETKSDKLILISDVDGVQQEGKTISVLTARETEKLIEDKIAVDGMRVKLENCIEALRNGVQRVHIINGLEKDSLRNEVYSADGVGTMIVREAEKKKYIKEELEKEKAA
ncbi:MAG: acetylglutamate kinase [Pseudomonadota bacterium]